MDPSNISSTGHPLPPLDGMQPSIRLLKVRNDNDHEDRVTCNIETFALARCPTYKALSYTWGNPFPPDQVFNPIGQPFPSDIEFQERAFDWYSEDSMVQCNGELIRVGRNLFEALLQLRASGEQGYIWIDRLCIDQLNVSERSSQVALMPKIYSNAAEVIVWLGRGGEDSLAALEIQNNFAGPIFDLVTEGKLTEADLQSHDPNDDSYLEEFGLKVTMLDVWFAWTQFFRRSWFYRRWTLQETALANSIEVLCGDQRLDWYKLGFLVKYFRISRWGQYLRRYMATGYQPGRALLAREFIESVLSDPRSWKSECIASYNSFGIGAVWVEILYRSCMLQCSDARDMIYSILGIVENIVDQMPELRDSHTLTANYNISAVEVYQRVIKICIETVPDLSILSLVQDPNRRSISGLPSWVPDLYGMAGYVMDKRLGLNRRRPGIPQYNTAFCDKAVPAERYVQGSKLHLRGRRLGKLATCSIDFASNDSEKILSSIIDICSTLQLVLRDGQDRVQALWRTIVGDSELYSRPAPKELGACFHDWILKYLFILRTSSESYPEQLSTICKELTQLSKQDKAEMLLPDVSEGGIWRNRLEVAYSGNAYQELKQYISLEPMQRFEAAAVLHNRVLFTTTENDIGYGHVSSMPGDEVWVLENGRTPFILRPTIDISSFMLIGECYAHGIMDGQLLMGTSIDYVPLSLV
ncbi:heterokaryon incompatibility protein-domain-containing protein [Xylogone sp. PMI_703]|nr:heterokaryon incompatibility protein-domain-containing protein [Xylogone sp. PMI_703]